MKRNAIAISIGLSCLGLALPAAAQEDTGDLSVTTDVVATCFFGTINPLNFADYGSELLVDGSTTLQATCTTGTDYIITFGDGANASGGLRRMLNGTVGTAFLSYHLYETTGAADEITLAAGADNEIEGTGTGSAQVVDVFGRIDAGQPLVIGAYTDTVGLTIELAP